MASAAKCMTSPASTATRQGPTVAAGVAKALIDLAVSKGAGRRRLLKRSKIASGDLSDQDNRIPLTKYMALLEAGVELCDEPALSLQFGEACPMPDLSIVGLIGQYAESITDAYSKINRYAPLLIDTGEDTDGRRFELFQDKDGVWFELKGGIYAEYPRLAESAFARSVCCFAREFGDQRFVKTVHFTHEEPAYRTEYDRIFKVPVVFASSRNALLIDENVLSLRLPPSNSYVSGIFNAHADRLLNRLERSQTLRRRVEDAVIPLLPAGEASMERIAQRMGLSRRTLHRRLKAEGVSYERLLDELRCRMALRLLRGSRLTVNETAYRLGFSDPSAFSRAFKRWTGKSPGRVRASRTGS